MTAPPPPPQHHVASTPQLATQDEATQSENGVLSQWETVGPIDTTHTQPIQSVSFQAGSGASSESRDGTTDGYGSLSREQGLL